MRAFRIGSGPRPAVLAGAGAVLAVSLLLSCAPTIPKFQFTYSEPRMQLDNGLKLVVLPVSYTPLVEVDVRYEVGSKEDPPNKAGLAHLVEHLMFEQRLAGPDKPPFQELWRELSVTYNAYTIWDQTHYMVTARRENLPALIRLEAARMVDGCRTLDDAVFQREREVVRNEIRQRMGTPDGQIPQILLDEAYPEGHAYRRYVGGDDKQLTNITLDDVCDFMASYYTPDRATVVVAGNVKPEEVRELTYEAFAGITDKQSKPGKEVAPLTIRPGRAVHELDVERTSVHVLWAMPPQYGEHRWDARFMMGALTGQVAGFGSEWDFSCGVGASPLGGPDAPVLVISIELCDDDDVDEALEFVWKSASRAHRFFEDGSFSTEQRQLMKADHIMRLESIGARTNLLGDLVQFDGEVDFKADEEYFIHDFKRIDQIDGGRVRSFVKRTLDKDKARVVVIKAREGAKRGDRRAGLRFNPSAHDNIEKPLVDPAEAKRPMQTPKADSILSEAKRFELGNGMKVVMLPYPTLPVTTVRMVFNVGAAHEPADKPGLASVAAGMLNPPRGANVFGEVGASWGGDVSDDYTVFSASGMEIYLDVMIKGMERLLKVGDYRQESIESWQKNFKRAMKLATSRQRDAFSRELAAAVWGPEHPYTLKGAPTVDSIGRIGRDEVYAFKSKHYSAGNATLIIAGSFDPARAEKLVRDTFGGWDRGTVDSPVPPTPAPRSGPEYIGIVGEQLPQMQVTIAYPTPAGMDGQQAARLVLTEMLNSRMGDIRTKLASSYGVRASRATKIGPSMYTMGGAVDAQRAGESLAAMREGIATLRSGEEFDLDFARARRAVLKRLLGQSTESGTLASYLGLIAQYNLPPTYWDKLVRYVGAVSTAQIKALIAQELDPSKEIIVLLADKATLETAFSEAGIENYRLVDVH